MGEYGVSLRPAELVMLLDGIELSHIRRRQRYQRPPTQPNAEGL